MKLKPNQMVSHLLHRCRSCVVVLAAWVCWVALSIDVLAEDWPNWRGPNRNGNSTEINWLEEWTEDRPRILWRAQVGTGFSSVAVAHGRLFTMGNSADVDTLWCLNALSGTVNWRHEHPADLDDRFFEGGPTSTPTVDDERVYALSRQGMLHCLEVGGGAVVWAKNIATETEVAIPGWGFSGSPVVFGNSLILNVGSAGTAVNKRDGAILWKSGPAEAGYMTPLPSEFDGKSMVLVASGKTYAAVQPESGKVLWQHRWLTTFGCNAADPIVSMDRVFLSSGYNRGSALLQIGNGDPVVVWTTKEFQNQLTSSVLLGGYIYGVDGNDTGPRSLKCVELATGKIMWSEEGFGSASLMSANQRLIILSDLGELIIATASPEGFRIVARKQVLNEKCWSVPVLAGGLIYCRSATGELVCLDVRK